MTLLLFLFLERCADHEAEAMFVGGGELVVVQAAHILDVDELEDVVDAQREFQIGSLGIDDVRPFGEVHQQRRTGILLEVGIILVGELAPEAAQTDILTPLEFLQQGDAVEDLSI